MTIEELRTELHKFADYYCDRLEARDKKRREQARAAQLEQAESSPTPQQQPPSPPPTQPTDAAAGPYVDDPAMLEFIACMAKKQS